MISFKGCHFPKEVVLLALQLYLAYPLSYTMVEEMLRDRGIRVDHSTIQRWVVKFSSQLAACFQKRKRPVSDSWKMDETYIKVKGKWVYQYRAIDKAGQTIDYLLSEQRDEVSARRFFEHAFQHHPVPRIVNMDKSRANKAALDSYNQQHNSSDEATGILIRQIKYLNNRIEQDHRFIKRKVRPMLGFKSFEAARHTLVGIELMHMLRKGQMLHAENMTISQQFYSLAG